MKRNLKVSRREFCRRSAAGFAGIVAASAAPVFVPARVLGAGAPSKKLALGVIGCGRIANAQDATRLTHEPMGLYQ